jgi:non-specific serine/threonine protein kinase
VHLLPELTSFVGRTRERAELARLLDEARLVTLAGPGGVGKTRLATRLALEAAADYADGVHVLELAPLTDPSLVARTLAESLGVSEQPEIRAVDSIASALRGSRMLLFLDNCEHVVEATAELAEHLLGRCPYLRLLVTSREPLGVAGERVFRLSPLTVPEGDSLEQLGRSEAVQLFVERARAARSDFSLSGANAAAIARVCRRLDGLPLAIELAANHVAALAPNDIAQHLDSALRLVPSGRRTAPARQQTLEAAIAWSYDLLTPGERALFDRLTVFAGGFALDAAEALSGQPSATLGQLSSLVAKSMIQAEPQTDGGLRYRLLEPLRSFGRARLTAAGELEPARRQHADFVVRLAERAAPQLLGPDQIAWSQRLDRDWDNIRLADDWLNETGEVEQALRLASALSWWWSRPDRQAEARVRFERVLAMPDAAGHPALRGHVLGAAATCALLQSDMPAAARMLDEALRIGRAEQDAWLEGLMLCLLGTLRLFQGQVDGADALLRESLSVARAAGLPWIEARALDTWAAAALARGDRATAEQRVRDGLQVARAGLDPWSNGMALTSLGDLLRARGDVEQASAAYEEALALFRAIDVQGGVQPGPVHNLAQVALQRNQPLRAAELFVEAAERYRRVGSDRRGVAECIVGLAGVALRTDRPELAARLFGSAEAVLDELGTTVSASNMAAYEALGAGLLAAPRGAGRKLSEDDALAQARALARPPQPEPESPSAGLTQREADVARLLARGLTNKQIADLLVITEKTAKNHTLSGCSTSSACARAPRSPRAPTSSACATDPPCHPERKRSAREGS